MSISVGDVFCYIGENSDFFTKHREYISRKDGCIEDNYGDKNHIITGAFLTKNFIKL